MKVGGIIQGGDDADMRCSNAVCKRIITFVERGGSKAEAAGCFEVSRAGVDNRLTLLDALSCKRPGVRTVGISWTGMGVSKKEPVMLAYLLRHDIWTILW